MLTAENKKVMLWSSGGFTVYSVSLAAYDLILAVLFARIEWR